MPEPQRFPYTVNNSEWGEAGLMPYLPLTLMANQKSVNISVLVDSGAAASILPYDVGLQLGFIWEEQTTTVNLSGNLSGLGQTNFFMESKVYFYRMQQAFAIEPK